MQNQNRIYVEKATEIYSWENTVETEWYSGTNNFLKFKSYKKCLYIFSQMW